MQTIATTYTEDVVDYDVVGHDMFVSVFNEDDSVDYLTNNFTPLTAQDAYFEVVNVIARPGQTVGLFDGERYVSTQSL